MLKEKTKADHVFLEEERLLRHGKELLAGKEHSSAQLLEEYKYLLKGYEKLLKMTNKVFNISDLQGKMLKQRELEIRNLLNHSEQGFLTFDADMLVHKQYSTKCVELFGKKIGGANFVQLLAGNDQREVTFLTELLQTIFTTNDRKIKQRCFEQLPTMVELNQRHVKIHFKEIAEIDGNPDHSMMMVVMTDVTEQLQSQARVEYLSFRDSLTSLYNRSFAECILPELTSLENLPLSIIMVDMNGLKLTNDVFGHQTGDAILKKTADLLLNVTRSDDFIARWGGDEFLIFLPSTDEAECQKMMNRLVKACQKTKPDPIQISLSLGTATMNVGDGSIQDVITRAEKQMYKVKLIEGRSVRDKLIAEIQSIIRTKGIDDSEHIARITSIARKFASMLGMKESAYEMKQLTTLASLHDIGMVRVPTQLIVKPGSYTAEEWEIVKGHSELGYRLAQAIGEFEVAEAILGMHERWDGQGYPFGLRETQIPYLARLLSIVDVYDVMTHDQIYKKAKTRQEALAEIDSLKGKQFDPELAALFVQNIELLFSEWK
ncbi:bifunctional diguanylate cyclase/phosphohydrolase [Brevibacillus sp. SYSU BS000544]|uniref:bifunctional diguanylate cyclase/phosphohydrolase n=1 Tax=Brevibacillus sp. SYSU BS000544 TaxID=3416443 RepID=UPI003CE456B1